MSKQTAVELLIQEIEKDQTIKAKSKSEWNEIFKQVRIMKEEKDYTLATTETVELLQKYDFEDEDFGEDSFDVKLKIQNLVHLFALINNEVGHCTSPEEWEMLDKTRDTLIDYLEKYHLNK